MPNVLVYAPARLEAGFSFEANVDGRTFTVVVPEGGVEKGQAMEVPYPELPQQVDDHNVGSVGIDGGMMGPIIGRWKHSLCKACCNGVCGKGICWMTLFCSPFVMAQLLTRLGMTWDGRIATHRSQLSMTYGVIVLLFVLAIALEDFPHEDFPVFRIAFFIYALVVGTRLRREFRKRYSIQPSCCCRNHNPDDNAGGCANCCDDCCCMFWCRCCSTLQMLRHTHDEERYPYEACTVDGLPYDATEPMITTTTTTTTIAGQHQHDPEAAAVATAVSATTMTHAVTGTSTITTIKSNDDNGYDGKQGSSSTPIMPDVV